MKPLGIAVDMDTGTWSSACGAKACAACAEHWPHIPASSQLGEVMSAQAVGAASRCTQRAGSTWGYWWDSHFVPCRGGNWPYQAHRGAEEEFHLLTWCWRLRAFVSCFRHPWISPHVSSLGCIPHLPKGKLMCGEVKWFAQGQEWESWRLNPSLLKPRQYLNHLATIPLENIFLWL